MEQGGGQREAGGREKNEGRGRMAAEGGRRWRGASRRRHAPNPEYPLSYRQLSGRRCRPSGVCECAERNSEQQKAGTQGVRRARRFGCGTWIVVSLPRRQSCKRT